MPTSISISRGRRIMIIIAAIAVGAFGYLLVDFRSVSDAVNANADLNALRTATQAVHRTAQSQPPAGARDLEQTIGLMRTTFESAFSNAGGVLGDLRADQASISVGANLTAFEAAVQALRAGEISEGEFDDAYYLVADELDALLANLSAAGIGETARMRTTLLVAGIAAVIAASVLSVGLRFWRRRMIESVQELRSSDERFRRSLDNATDAAVIVDSQMRVVYANEATSRLSGYDLDALLGRPYSDFWVDFDLDAERAVKQLNALGAVRFTRDSRRADGTIITVEHDVIALGDGTYLGVAHDATERLRTLAALEESEQRFRTVIDTMQNALVIIDNDRRPIMVNRALTEMLGYSAEEILAFDQPNLLVDPDTRGLLVELFDKVRDGALGSTPFGASLIKKDGGALDVEGLLSPFIRADGSRAVLAEAKDVTEQLVAEQGRREAVREVHLGEARLSRAQQIAHLGSWELDLQTLRGWWSDEEFRLLGLEPQSLEPTFELFLSFVHPGDRDHVRAVLRTAIESGETFDLQYRIIRKDGEVRVFSEHGEVTRDAGGHPIAAQGTVRDLTEDVRVREQLADAQKLQAVGTLAAGVAHDFNNLLTVIGGHLTLALDGDQPSRALLEPAKRASDRASQLANQLLDFARSGAIAQGEERVVVDLRQLARDAAVMVEQNLDPLVTLRIDIAGGPLFAAAERGALDRVCVNLLFNARDAVMEHASALADDSYQPRIDMELRAASDHEIELVVTDNGTGMPEEVRSRVFEPFFSTKKDDQSTGLGLATTYGIVTRLGGGIDVTSEPGAGATFTVRLPMAPAMQAPPEPAEVASPEPASGRLLLVDDEEDLLSFAATTLEHSGYETVRATDGPTALQSADGETFDLVLLDVNLGEMDGWEVLRKLHDRDPAQRVLMWSGVAAYDEAMRQGAVGLLSKPFDSHKLLDAIAEALRPDAPAPTNGTNERKAPGGPSKGAG